MAEENNRLDIDWVRTIAGALAAVSSAVLLSTLGAAGTLIGAALGSVAATVSTALYSQGLARSREKVAAVHLQALQKVGVAQADVRRAAQDPASGDLEEADERLAEAEAELGDAAELDPRPWTERLRALPWRRIGVYAAGTFAAAVVALSVVEAVLGNPVSSYTGGSEKGGGTSISRLTGSDSNRDTHDRDGSEGEEPDRDVPRDDAGTTPSEGTGDTPEGGTGSTPAPTPAPTPTPSPSEEPDEEPAETPTTGTPTPTPEVSEEAEEGSGQRAPSGVPSDGGLE